MFHALFVLTPCSLVRFTGLWLEKFVPVAFGVLGARFDTKASSLEFSSV